MPFLTLGGLVMEINSSTIVYSGVAAGVPCRRRGVACIMSEKAACGWHSTGSLEDPVSERIIYFQLKSHTGFLSLITMYVFTNEPTSVEKSVAYYIWGTAGVCAASSEERYVDDNGGI